jgi:hypothetical protein
MSSVTFGFTGGVCRIWRMSGLGCRRARRTAPERVVLTRVRPQVDVQESAFRQINPVCEQSLTDASEHREAEVEFLLVDTCERGTTRTESTRDRSSNCDEVSIDDRIQDRNESRTLLVKHFREAG